MEYRLAVMEDLPSIKAMYQKIVKHMAANQMEIWDDISPCSFFQKDIENHSLYLLLDQGEILSAFALYDTHPGEKCIGWKTQGKAFYINRFGVNAAYLRKGIGSTMLINAKKTAKEQGAKSLRLFVVDINIPAIALYHNNGFTRATGIYQKDLAFLEYGYEISLSMT